jgi:hypothetical protein
MYINWGKQTSLIKQLSRQINAEVVVLNRHTYFSEDFVWAFARLPFWNDTENKLDQVDHILETEGTETKFVSDSVLSMRA